MDDSESTLADERMPLVPQNNQTAIPSMQSGKSQFPTVRAQYPAKKVMILVLVTYRGNGGKSLMISG